MQRTFMRGDYNSLYSTPSKRQKYDSYTPRKRYVKDQEEPSSFYQPPGRSSHHTSPLAVQDENLPRSRMRTLGASRRQYTKNVEDIDLSLAPTRSRQLPRYEFNEPLEDCTPVINCRPSLRKHKYMRPNEEKQVQKKFSYDEENRDESNYTKKQLIKFVEPEPISLTPRRATQRCRQNADLTLQQKMAALNNKIARLERMTPQKPATPRASRVIENYGYESTTLVFDRDEPKFQKYESVGSSQVSQTSVVSERQNQILSRVSLGRLVEEEENQNEIEVIQDMSYRISCKLQSIIRNFS